MCISKRIAKNFSAFLAGFAVATLSASSGFSGPQKQVTLANGSVIQAEVLSLSNGTHTLRPSNLGIFTRPQSKIRSINSGAQRSTSFNQSTTHTNPISRQNPLNRQSGLTGSDLLGPNASDLNS